MERLWIGLGSAFALLSVAAGAFGAHALRGHLSEDALSIFETAARYQMYHALALLLMGVLAGKGGVGLTSVAGWLFTGGGLLFSGSLYLLAITDVKWLGAITPLGGLCFLAGWAALLIGAIRGT